MARGRGARQLAALAVALLLMLGLGVTVGASFYRPATDHPEATARAYLRYREILTYVDRDYVDSVDAEGLTDYALAQMLGRLDPHSVYIPARERAQADAFLLSSFDGVGLEYNVFRDTATVLAALPGGPAEAAGLRPGDQLLRLDDAPLAGAGLSARQFSQRLRGARGSHLRLLVARPGLAAPLPFDLVRAALPDPSVEPALLLPAPDEASEAGTASSLANSSLSHPAASSGPDGNPGSGSVAPVVAAPASVAPAAADARPARTGYLRVSRFAAGTYDEFKVQLAEIRRLGATRLVLDLRDNPGGYLDRATRVADEFIAGARQLVHTVGRDEQYASQTYAHAAGDWEQEPLVVLVDENSASAAEVLAGALQDHDRALLVWRRTFGKGLVQQPIRLQDGGELRLTVARYYTPSGRCIQKPYGPDRASYDRELSERDARGERPQADSTRPGERFRTDHGRVVYGGGGIVPDVLVPHDSLRRTAYHAHLDQAGALQACALRIFRRHRAELTALRPAQYAAEFQVSDAELDDLARLGTLAGLPPADPAALRRAAPALRASLRVGVARLAYGPAVARALRLADDPELRQAMR